MLEIITGDIVRASGAGASSGWSRAATGRAVQAGKVRFRLTMPALST